MCSFCWQLVAREFALANALNSGFDYNEKTSVGLCWQNCPFEFAPFMRAGGLLPRLDHLQPGNSAG